MIRFRLSVLHKMLRWMEQQLPIADKIGIPLAAIAVMTATVLSANTIAAARSQIDRAYRTQARQLANVIQAEFAARYTRNLEDRATTSRFLQELQQTDATIVSIHIYRIIDKQPVLWASSRTPVTQSLIEPEDVEPIQTGVERQVVEAAANQLETVVPLRLDQGEIIASIGIYTSLAARDAEVFMAAQRIIITSAVGITVQSAALMLVLYWSVLRRVTRLSQVAVAVAEGNTDVHLPEGAMPLGRDELFNVAHEFDRMLDALRRRAYQQEALAELGQQALEEIDLAELLDKVVHTIVRVLKVDAADLLELVEGGEQLHLRAGVGWHPEWIGQIFTRDALAFPVTAVLHTTEPIAVDNLPHPPGQDDCSLRPPGISSISVLITHFEKPFGLLSARSNHLRSFAKDDALFLKAVAGLVSTAIDRHRIELVITQAEAALARAEAAEAAKQALETEIIERQRVELALRESEERYALAASGANDGLWDWNLRTNEIYFSPRWKAMLGYSETEISNNPNDWFDHIHPDDYERVQLELMHHRDGLTAHFESEYRLRQKDGTYRWMLSRGLAVRDATGMVYRIAGSQTDITARKLAEAQLLHNAFHDELTGLANRALFTDRLERAIAIAQQRNHACFAVLFLDLDRFKVINDSLGHLMGDQLLINTAERLQQCLRSSDTCARLGGDEFAILLEEIQQPQDVIEIVEHIQQVLKAPFTLAEQEVFVNASIGLVLDVLRYATKEELLRDADTAMYCSKATGRGCYTIFTPAMHEQAVSLLHLEADLRRALERQELHLLYQPILSLHNQRLTGFEALLRWQHPNYGLMLPADFIGLAEETGLIISIGWWVLRQACQQMRQWQTRFALDPQITISVNLSGKQFAQPDLVDQIQQILQETELSPQSLKLEITESVIMNNACAAAEMMQRLKALGVQLAMDDFGTGYSSLSYLHRFPIDTLKIDHSFINSADNDLEKLEITRTVIALAWNLGMNVVAEGVETDRQMAQLKLLKCELAQGFLFSQPLDSQAATALLDQVLSC